MQVIERPEVLFHNLPHKLAHRELLIQWWRSFFQKIFYLKHTLEPSMASSGGRNECLKPPRLIFLILINTYCFLMESICFSEALFGDSPQFKCKEWHRNMHSCGALNRKNHQKMKPFPANLTDSKLRHTQKHYLSTVIQKLASVSFDETWILDQFRHIYFVFLATF